MKQTVRKRTRRAGFTLVELLIVVVIVGILAAAAVPVYLSNVRRARTAEATAGLGAVRHEESVYKAENSAYLAVTAGSVANEPNASSNPGLGLSFAENSYFGAGCFSVATDATYGYVATCDGGADSNAAPKAADVAEVIVQIRGVGGQYRISYDGGTTYTGWN